MNAEFCGLKGVWLLQWTDVQFCQFQREGLPTVHCMLVFEITLVLKMYKSCTWRQFVKGSPKLHAQVQCSIIPLGGLIILAPKRGVCESQVVQSFSVLFRFGNCGLHVHTYMHVLSEVLLFFLNFNPLTPEWNCPRPTPNSLEFYWIISEQAKPQNKPYAQ